MGRVPSKMELAHVQSAFRDVNSRLDQFWEGGVDLGGNRVTNAGAAQDGSDYTTLSQVQSLISAALGAFSMAPVTSSSPVEPVAWKNAVGVTVSGNNLTKTGGSGWNAGAVSSRAIISGAGYVEFTASENTTARIIGLSHGDTDQSLADIDFAVYLTAAAGLEVYEAGTLRGAFGAYAPGDIIRVAVNASGIVDYRKNGATFYTSGAYPMYSLLVDTSLFHTGATLTNVLIAGTLITW